MNLDFYNLDLLEKELEKLPPLHRIAFAASICERMLPNYSAFTREVGWGNPSILRVALDEVWQILQGKPLDEPKIYQLMEECSNNSPSGDDSYNSHYLPEAEVTVIAISNTLYLCLEPTPQRTIGVARQAEETLFSFISFLASLKAFGSWDKKTLAEQTKEVASHQFTVREIAKQKEDLQRLKKVEILDREFLESLRASFNNSGRSLIDLS
ncbi:YjaG family protein [Phormidium nigroviride]